MDGSEFRFVGPFEQGLLPRVPVKVFGRGIGAHQFHLSVNENEESSQLITGKTDQEKRIQMREKISEIKRNSPLYGLWS